LRDGAEMAFCKSPSQMALKIVLHNGLDKTLTRASPYWMTGWELGGLGAGQTDRQTDRQTSPINFFKKHYILVHNYDMNPTERIY
jgi:hypothetical protein